MSLFASNPCICMTTCTRMTPRLITLRVFTRMTQQERQLMSEVPLDSHETLYHEWFQYQNLLYSQNTAREIKASRKDTLPNCLVLQGLSLEVCCPSEGTFRRDCLVPRGCDVEPSCPSFRALPGRLKFTVRRHQFNEDFLSRALCGGAVSRRLSHILWRKGFALARETHKDIVCE